MFSYTFNIFNVEPPVKCRSHKNTLMGIFYKQLQNVEGMTLNIFKEKNLQLHNKEKQTFIKPFRVQMFICGAPAAVVSPWKKLLGEPPHQDFC